MAERQQFPRERADGDENLISLTREECCAVQSAFGAVDKKLIAGLGDAFGARIGQLFQYLGHIVPPQPIAFTVWEDDRNAYAHIIEQELQRLETGKIEFRSPFCKHTEANHANALKSILKRVSPAIN